MKIEYYSSEQSYEQYFTKLRKLAERPEIKKVCDIGGGANPLFSLDQVKEYGLEYTILDISEEELAKAPNQYNKIQANIEEPDLSLNGDYDLVISKFLAEHISNAFVFHQNIFNLLKCGGYAFHYFPTLYNLPFLTNLLLPENLSYPILLFFQPSRIKEGKSSKFPAYYNWCFGPTKKNIKRFTQLGYSIEEYIGFFGHGFYEKSPVLKPLNLIEKAKSQLLIQYPSPWLTFFAHILLKKE
ncbi:MAG: hypothetical protein RLZZ04_892 [Cyanobacteriota bacterium]|jgi:2-polyprenyl-3-methyl-5-hydroxy-6-metoxy-1,4-benzoquinol methylase